MTVALVRVSNLGNAAKYGECGSGFAGHIVAAMPSQLHEAQLLLFGNRPTLAPELAGVQAAVERLSAATIEDLDAIGERLLSAQSLGEALG